MNEDEIVKELEVHDGSSVRLPGGAVPSEADIVAELEVHTLGWALRQMQAGKTIEMSGLHFRCRSDGVCISYSAPPHDSWGYWGDAAYWPLIGYQCPIDT